MSQEQLHRVLDAALEDGGVRSPLGGLFPADLPVPTLDAALAPHLATMPNLEAHMVEIARAKAEEVAEDYPNLSVDERAAIVLYTAEEQPREGSVYYALNAALRARDRAQAKPWVGFIWLLLHALKKLPGVPRPTVVRGCKKAAGELGQQAKKGAKFQFAGFTSTATTVDVMSEFIGKARDLPNSSFAPRVKSEPCPPPHHHRVATGQCGNSTSPSRASVATCQTSLSSRWRTRLALFRTL